MEGMFFRDRNEERLLENTELFTVEEIRYVINNIYYMYTGNNLK